MATVSIPRPQDTPPTTDTRASWLSHRPLLAYSALAYGLSWLILLPAGLGLLPDSAGILSTLAPFGPAIAAFVVAALTGGWPAAGRLLRRLGQWRVGVHWYLLILVGIPLLELLGAFAVLGAVPLGDLGRNWPLIFTRYLPYVLLNTIFIGLAEEPGWRGFALPRLQERHGPLVGSAALAALWIPWHLPNLLFGGWTAASYALWAVATLGSVVVYTWVYNRTGGSVLLAMLLHAAINTGLGLTTWLLPALGEGPDARLRAHGAAGVALVAAALVLVVATRGRLGYRPAPPAPAGESGR